MTLHVVKATERLAHENKKVAQENRDREAAYDAEPVDADTAQTVCDARAEREFPYGVKVHWIKGKLAEQKTEVGWFLKVTATVTNMYGATQKNVNVECHVSGTNGSPTMDDFRAH